jgi:hypothetical protein
MREKIIVGRGGVSSALSHLLGRQVRNMMRPFALEITAGDFAFAAGHCRIARHRPFIFLSAGEAHRRQSYAAS